MSSTFLIDCFALIKGWAMGFFVFHMNGFIHLLPVIATVALLLRFFYFRSGLRLS